jgi:8-oxo-dGTP diphosphatase
VNFFRKPGARCDAAVAIVHSRAQDSILLIRRSEREDDPWSGHWSLPGGRWDAGDSDALHTALRELEEECGIRLSREHLKAELPHAHARRKMGSQLIVAPFVFDVKAELPVVLDPREAVEARWVPLSLLHDTKRHGVRAVPGMPPELLFPSVALGTVPLWGFTYRLLSDWLDTISGSEKSR